MCSSKLLPQLTNIFTRIDPCHFATLNNTARIEEGSCPMTETAKHSTTSVLILWNLKSTSENRIDKQRGKAKICKVCGKEGQMTAIMKQIEAKQLTAMSIPCNACDKTFYTRHALSMHNRNCHS